MFVERHNRSIALLVVATTIVVVGLFLGLGLKIALFAMLVAAVSIAASSYATYRSAQRGRDPLWRQCLAVLAGQVACLVLIVVGLVGWHMTENITWMKFVYVAAWLNLFELLPLGWNRLSGSRVAELIDHRSLDGFVMVLTIIALSAILTTLWGLPNAAVMLLLGLVVYGAKKLWRPTASEYDVATNKAADRERRLAGGVYGAVMATAIMPFVAIERLDTLSRVEVVNSLLPGPMGLAAIIIAMLMLALASRSLRNA